MIRERFLRWWSGARARETRPAGLRAAAATAALLCAASLGACSRARSDPPGDAAAPPPASAFLPEELPPVPPKGMVYIPPGVLLAGTPPGRLPRLPDTEMPGAQVVLKGFFIDELPYPNEAGAIPRTNVTQPEALQLCEAQGKRLCTELEWERACKGPGNTTYPYGDTYRASECGTGLVTPGAPPMGLLAGCKSRFGVRDTHGGAWQWTSSPWGRGASGNLVTLRGGNAEAGDVVGRCANAIGRRPTTKSAEFGFRCCKGDQNLAEVTLDIVRGDPLRSVSNDPSLVAALEATPPQELAGHFAGKTPFRVAHTWRWRPVGNEELVLQSGCAATAPHSFCGVAIGRPSGAALEPVAFASTGWWIPTLHEEGDPRDLWVFGGDELGAFRRRVAYAWGRVLVGDAEHKIPVKKRKKGR